ncbi:MAG: DUF268 domain-containing protein [Bacteroidales bacterium]|jgi:SAM-dependent methyltransferase|nr:DUF268 domain-containing protein [Bacteroidales bacterium]
MRNRFRKIYRYLMLAGLDPVMAINTLRGLPFFLRDRRTIRKQRGSDRTFPFGRGYPVLGDRFTESGTMSGHYFHQDLYVARRIFTDNPGKHVDIGSRTDGFVAHVAVFREIEIIDIREQKSSVRNIKFRKADLMTLPENMAGYCDSLSALHSIEHFGLGRYGDAIDYNGHLKALENIRLMLKPGGKFYLSVPIGLQRIEFNAHRVFSVRYLLNILEEHFSLRRFSYIDDNGDFHEDAELNEGNIVSNFGCTYGCGIFELVKI